MILKHYEKVIKHSDRQQNLSGHREVQPGLQFTRKGNLDRDVTYCCSPCPRRQDGPRREDRSSLRDEVLWSGTAGRRCDYKLADSSPQILGVNAPILVLYSQPKDG